jgi:hypothetical protein
LRKKWYDLVTHYYWDEEQQIEISAHAETCIARWLDPSFATTECCMMPEIVTLLLRVSSAEESDVHKMIKSQVSDMKSAILTATYRHRSTRVLKVTCNE